jgi:Ca2+-binding EF-hand superfamily protein
MKKNTAVFFNIIGSCFVLASVLPAQGPGGPGGRGRPPSLLITAMDTNQDGKLSAEEIAAAPKTLHKADINSDGMITQDELQPPPETAVASPNNLSQQLMLFDENHDGVLTRDELPERLQPLFERADTNRDGKITVDELRALAARQTLPTGAQKVQQSRDPVYLALDTDRDGTIAADEIANASKSLLALDKDHDREISAAEMRQPEATPADQADHMLAENDADHDGKISKAEAPDFLRGQFAAIDKNGNGFLDRDELIAYFTSNRGGRGGPGYSGSSGGPPEGSHDGTSPR